MARAALRLSPSGRARAWIAIDLRLGDRPADAIRVVDQELAAHVRPPLAAALLECRASALSVLGDPGGAARDAWRSHLEHCEQVTALVNGLHYALRAGDKTTAERAGTALDGLVEHPTTGLLQLFDVLEHQTHEEQAMLNPSTRHVARALQDSAGPLAWKVFHVYTQ